MKARGIVIIDWSVESFREAAIEEEALETALTNLNQASRYISRSYQFSELPTPQSNKSRRKRK